MATTYPSLYRAKVAALNGGSSIKAFVPQVYGDTPIDISQFLGITPRSYEFGWVFFQSGNPSYPVWASGASDIIIGPGGIDGVQRIVAGTGITVDETDPFNPIVTSPPDGVQSLVAGSGVAINATDPYHPVVSSPPDGVQSITAGTNVTVNNANPAIPVVTAADEVWVGPTDPIATRPTVELWQDTTANLLKARVGGAWVAANSVYVSAGNALGIVAVGGMAGTSPLDITAATTTNLTNALSVTMLTGRRYRVKFLARAFVGYTGAANAQISVWLKDGGTDLRVVKGDPYTFAPAPYQAINVEWYFDGDGATHSIQVVGSTNIRSQLYHDFGTFLIEDVGPNSSPALPIPDTPPAWNSLPFGTNWGNYGAGYQVCQYRKIGDVVSLRGLAHASAASTTLGTLPAGFRPPAVVLVQVRITGAAGRLDIDTNGVMTISEAPAGTWWDWLTLTGVSFSTTA